MECCNAKCKEQRPSLETKSGRKAFIKQQIPLVLDHTRYCLHLSLQENQGTPTHFTDLVY